MGGTHAAVVESMSLYDMHSFQVGLKQLMQVNNNKWMLVILEFA